MIPPATDTAVGLGDWSLDAPLVLALVTAALYGLGSHRTASREHRSPAQRRRTASFLAGLLVLVIALDSPIDPLAEQLFWVHMLQHVLLLTVAPPLILLGRPWSRLWRAVPLERRRTVGRMLMTTTTGARLRRDAAWLGSPRVAFAAFTVVLLAWHVPALFDATLRSPALHVLEHELFFGSALLFWKQVVVSPPLHALPDPAARLALLTGAMVVSWVLAVVLALAPHPLYAPYAHELARPGGISALGDQQLAAGVMWVPGSIAFVIAIFAQVGRWLEPQAPARGPLRAAQDAVPRGA